MPRTPEEALAEAQRLLDRGMPFHAHEVLEDAWKSSAAPERELWRGLAQLAVGLTHAARGNPTGAKSLLDRAVRAIAPFGEDPPHGVDVTGLSQWARRLTDTLGEGAGAVSAAEEAPKLCPVPDRP